MKENISYFLIVETENKLEMKRHRIEWNFLFLVYVLTNLRRVKDIWKYIWVNVALN